MNNLPKRQRPIWLDAEDTQKVQIIDQRRLPHEYVLVDLQQVDDVIRAIKEMYVRGAPLIGVTAAYGVYLAAIHAPDGGKGEADIRRAAERIKDARPTAVNLAWAVDKMTEVVLRSSRKNERISLARKHAGQIAEEEAENCRKIGENGLALIERIHQSKKGGESVNILTHCNAGWLACVEYGTATAPVYAAYDKGLNVHVWVDETRPLNQGARLTAWELARYGVRHTLITDNAGGHLMQHGLVDMVIVGTDRTTHTGDVANKIGTYLKALAARDNRVPFYVALPSSTFDWQLRDGLKEIPIEERDPDEVRSVQGFYDQSVCSVLISPPSTPVANIAFDVTPARLVTGFITERGVCQANEVAIKELFPEKFSVSAA